MEGYDTVPLLGLTADAELLSELCRLHDEWVMTYWSLPSEVKRAHIPTLNLGAFMAWSRFRPAIYVCRLV